MLGLNGCKSGLPCAAGLMAAAFGVAFGMLVAVPAHSQLVHPADGPTPTFEVASIRPSRADGGFENYQLSSARFHVENAPLTALIRFAFDIRSDDQLPKEPAWIASEKFDIDAKVDDSDVEAMSKLLPDQKLERYRLMMQALLGERFKLKVSTHMKELPVYTLIVTKSSAKLTASDVSPEAIARRVPILAGGSKGELHASSVSMAMFTQWLSGREETDNRVVIDATGLKGGFDFTLHWTPDSAHMEQLNGAGAAQGGASVASQDSARLSIITALQEQLGLKLEPRRAPVEVLVIDNVERPSQN
ncbi:MAG TPA: TIGR03435 family protein [Terracidiphilus sp.]|nr:TIGR03435 family protein [Terracidiphilus sp.]